jgi:hypothetical protein
MSDTEQTSGDSNEQAKPLPDVKTDVEQDNTNQDNSNTGATAASDTENKPPVDNQAENPNEDDSNTSATAASDTENKPPADNQEENPNADDSNTSATATSDTENKPQADNQEEKPNADDSNASATATSDTESKPQADNQEEKPNADDSNASATAASDTGSKPPADNQEEKPNEVDSNTSTTPTSDTGSKPPADNQDGKPNDDNSNLGAAGPSDTGSTSAADDQDGKQNDNNSNLGAAGLSDTVNKTPADSQGEEKNEENLKTIPPPVSSTEIKDGPNYINVAALNQTDESAPQKNIKAVVNKEIEPVPGENDTILSSPRHEGSTGERGGPAESDPFLVQEEKLTEAPIPKSRMYLAGSRFGGKIVISSPGFLVVALSGAIFFILSLIQVIIGSLHKNSCPGNQFIPIYLIVAGVLGIVLILSFVCLVRFSLFIFK